MRADDLEEEGTSGLCMFLPSIHMAMQEWASQEFINQFFGSIPLPLRMEGKGI